MKDNKSATFKYNNITDSKIFDSLENKVIDKSQFIKNALYYYIVMIEKGIVVDRNLPQDSDIKLADLMNGLDGDEIDLTGILKTLENAFSGTTLGTVLGAKKEGGVWYDSNGNE